MHSHTTPIRKPFTLADVVRVTGGRLTTIHDNWCKALEGGRCDCRHVDYHIVRAGGPRQ